MNQALVGCGLEDGHVRRPLHIGTQLLPILDVDQLQKELAVVLAQRLLVF